MIGISTPLFDLLGHVTIHELPTSEMDQITRRVNRQKTLDGGVVINDGGYSAGDRDIVIQWRVSNELMLRKAQRMVRLYPQLTVTTRNGAFVAAPERIDVRDGVAVLKLLVKDQY